MVLLLSLSCFDYRLWSKADELEPGIWDTGAFYNEENPSPLAGECDTQDLPTAVQQTRPA